MDVYECIRTRRTVREFKPDPVPEAIVQKILQAGRWAPSSSNTQPWHFVVVRARETIAALGRIATQGPFIGQAPLAIAIVMAHAGRPQLDAGRALQQMELMAWSEGSGDVFRRHQSARAARRHQGTAGYPRGDGTHHRPAVWVSARRAPSRRAPPQTDGRDRPQRNIWDRICPQLSPRWRSTRDRRQLLADASMRSIVC